MKILFLDIDGVINSVRSAVAFGGFPWNVKEEDIKLFDIVAIALIKKVCKKIGCKIILSSVWRRTIGYKKLAIALDLPIIGSTPIHISSTRGEEISEWLKNNIYIEKYAILDDDSDILNEQIPYFVKVNSKEGLSFSNYEKLLEILK